ncbi:MAG: alpha/beta hydrolase, partial [Betaproteobacteria bacterium]
ASPTCSKQVPQLRTQVDELLVKLDKQPRKISMVDPLTGMPREIGLTRDGVLMAVFSTLYVPEMVAVLPAALAQAKQGDFSALMAMSAAFGDFADDKIFIGMRFSVVCAEDQPRANAAGKGAEPAPFGDLFVREFSKGCEGWPKGAMAKDFDQPVVSDKPVLILSGGLDPVTPPPFGEEVKKSLPNSLHLIAPNVGHGVSSRGCAPKLIKKFIEAASVAGLDGKCLERLPRPLFYEPMRSKDEKKPDAAPADSTGKKEAAK